MNGERRSYSPIFIPFSYGKSSRTNNLGCFYSSFTAVVLDVDVAITVVIVEAIGLFMIQSVIVISCSINYEDELT